MKKILGLDLGTNSIGWALVEQNFANKEGNILGIGSRIIPMTQDVLGEFGRGNSISQTAERTGYRGVRRLRERHLLRRERLHRVLNILGFLPEYYAYQIDFEKRFGKFKNECEPKLVYYNNEFLFKDSFNEMLEDFRKHQANFLINNDGKDCLVPYDWTIYYLRKKALSQKIEKEELAWIILNFNQKRGYYQLRGEDFEVEKDKIFIKLEVQNVVDSGEKVKGKSLYDVIFTNGWKYDRQIVKTEDWIGKSKEFIVTESSLKDGSIKRTFKAVDSEKDWIAIKTKTEQEIDNSQKTVGTFIYENLLLDPNQKIKGKLVRTIERKFYKAELEQILRKQSEFHAELKSLDLLADCARELYMNNQNHQQSILAKDFVHLFLNDIIFYQRPLKSQKNLISNCTLESRKSKEGVVFPIKVISKSNPYFQEFRILQWLQNLAIYTKEDDKNVTQEFFDSNEKWDDLLRWLKSRKEIKQEVLLKFLLERKGFKSKALTIETAKYRWNYVQDKDYPAYETRALIQLRLDKVVDISTNFLNDEIEYQLWHLIYSVTDKTEYEKALVKFASKHNLDETSFVDSFKKVPPFKSEYGSYSEKAIKKLLPLMRFGVDWNYEQIDDNSKIRIDNIINAIVDENIKNRVREFIEIRNITNEKQFQNLPLWLAQYIVYNRHSESADIRKWQSVEDLSQFLKDFKQHSLRNPIVEQVITETLRVVKDIWVKYGKGAKDFFSEIHIELGREMKNTGDERKRLTNIVTDNENTNFRIKALLAELANDSMVENVRPYSPTQQDILKIYEEGVLNSVENIEEDILKISKTAQPSSADLKRYKLWLEQKYKSPYTGQIIPLNKLFTHEYEIEHIIPQSRYFDDSLSNKVICEAAVNKLKDNQIGLAFIKKHHGEVVQIGNGKTIKVLEVADYEEFVKQHYTKNRTKRNKLLMEEIPEQMIERQLNDTRYISKYISQILSNIVRDDQPESTDDGINSKNVLPGNGKITTKLKQDWGLNDVWNDLILPRFLRMNELTSSTDYTSINTNGKLIPTVPLEQSKGFSKKRIDHRHHAMDAFVIACATRQHINYLNNMSSKVEDLKDEEKRKRQIEQRNKLKNDLCLKTKPDSNGNYQWIFKAPWKTFTEDSRSALENLVVSFKQNTRVINKATNYYESYKDENGNLRIDANGNPKKGFIVQKGSNWAVRKALHKETVSGKIHLDRIKVGKDKILTATRKSLDASFNEKTILSITDTGIQKILLNYLKFKNNDSEIAFSPEGIDEMNKNITQFNEGKKHQPILKVRVFEQGSKFALGETGNKINKYVEAAKGTNLFFAIYQDKTGKRSYETIPLNIVIERQKQGFPSVPEFNEKGHSLLMTLSPNDLAYIPTEGENVDFNNIDFNRIYKVVSFTGGRLYTIPLSVSISIVNKIEYTQLNKIELTKEKEIIIKLKIDRLGNISKA